jgi:phage gp29-like protein
MNARPFIKQAERFKQMLSACQKADANCFLGQEMTAYGGIHATRDHNNVTNA